MITLFLFVIALALLPWALTVAGLILIGVARMVVAIGPLIGWIMLLMAMLWIVKGSGL